MGKQPESVEEGNDFSTFFSREREEENEKFPFKVYHNWNFLKSDKKLHNFRNYVNKCNEKHKMSWSDSTFNHIF